MSSPTQSPRLRAVSFDPEQSVSFDAVHASHSGLDAVQLKPPPHLRDGYVAEPESEPKPGDRLTHEQSWKLYGYSASLDTKHGVGNFFFSILKTIASIGSYIVHGIGFQVFGFWTERKVVDETNTTEESGVSVDLSPSSEKTAESEKTQKPVDPAALEKKRKADLSKKIREVAHKAFSERGFLKRIFHVGKPGLFEVVKNLVEELNSLQGRGLASEPTLARHRELVGGLKAAFAQFSSQENDTDALLEFVEYVKAKLDEVSKNFPATVGIRTASGVGSFNTQKLLANGYKHALRGHGLEGVHEDAVADQVYPGIISGIAEGLALAIIDAHKDDRADGNGNYQTLIAHIKRAVKAGAVSEDDVDQILNDPANENDQKLLAAANIAKGAIQDLRREEERRRRLANSRGNSDGEEAGCLDCFRFRRRNSSLDENGHRGISGISASGSSHDLDEQGVGGGLKGASSGSSSILGSGSSAAVSPGVVPEEFTQDDIDELNRLLVQRTAANNAKAQALKEERGLLAKILSAEEIKAAQDKARAALKAKPLDRSEDERVNAAQALREAAEAIENEDGLHSNHRKALVLQAQVDELNNEINGITPRIIELQDKRKRVIKRFRIGSKPELKIEAAPADEKAMDAAQSESTGGIVGKAISALRKEAEDIIVKHPVGLSSLRVRGEEDSQPQVVRLSSSSSAPFAPLAGSGYFPQSIGGSGPFDANL